MLTDHYCLTCLAFDAASSPLHTMALSVAEHLERVCDYRYSKEVEI